MVCYSKHGPPGISFSTLLVAGLFLTSFLRSDASAQLLQVSGTKIINSTNGEEVILNAVWGQDDYFVGRSMDVFITKLRKYLKDEPKIHIANIHGVGFKFEIKE